MQTVASPYLAPKSSASFGSPLRIVLVAPTPPPYGGMALQARLLERLLGEDGHIVVFVPSNPELPGVLSSLNQIRGLRTLTRLVIFMMALWKHARQSDVLHVFAASWSVLLPCCLPGCSHRPDLSNHPDR